MELSSDLEMKICDVLNSPAGLRLADGEAPGDGVGTKEGPEKQRGNILYWVGKKKTNHQKVIILYLERII